MDYGLEMSSLIWVVAIGAVGAIFIYFMREWQASKRELTSKNIDQLIVKTEYKDAKKNGRTKKGDFVILVGDRKHQNVILGKIIGFLPFGNFWTFFVQDVNAKGLSKLWSFEVYDVFYKLLPSGLDSLNLQIKGITGVTIKGRTIVLPNHVSKVSNDEVIKAWIKYKRRKHLLWAESQMSSQLNKGVFEAINMTPASEEEVSQNMDGYDFLKIAKEAEKATRG